MCTCRSGQTMMLGYMSHNQALQQDTTHHKCCSETNICDQSCITLEQPGQDHRDQLTCVLHRRLPQLWPQAMHKQLDRHMQQPCRREAVQQQLLPQSLQPPLLLPIVTASSALQLQVSPVIIVADAPSFKTGVLTEACTIIDARLLQFAFSISYA